MLQGGRGPWSSVLGRGGVSKMRVPPPGHSKMKRNEGGCGTGEGTLSLDGQKSLRGPVFALGLWTRGSKAESHFWRSSMGETWR